MTSYLLYAVYIQYEPSYKYDAEIESIWTTKELAEAAAKKRTSYSCTAYVSEIYINHEYLHTSPEEIARIEAEYNQK